MDKPTLLKKLDAMLDEFDRARTFGYIQIDFVAGKPDLVRKMTTQKINGGNTQHEPARENR